MSQLETGNKWYDRMNNKIIAALALLMVVIHMYYSQDMFDSLTYYNLHLGFSLLIVFLSGFSKSKKKLGKWMFPLLAVFSLFAVLYVHFLSEELQMRGWLLEPLDLAVGVILIVMSLLASVQAFGMLVPSLIVVFMIYPFFGQYLPEPWTTTAYSIPQTISNLSVGLTQGIYGVALKTSADYVFLFVVFGSLIGVTGVQQFFYEISKLIVGRVRSGSGLLSVVNSCFVGSITGSAIANVTITGAYTIPSMKKEGYRPEQAAAIEATASNGGQIMPPMMGVIAFVMAGFSGIPYIQVVVMAIIPALLYFSCVGLYTHFSVAKRIELEGVKIDYKPEPVDKKAILYRLPGFVIPIAIMIFMLSTGFSIMNVAFWCIISTIVLGFAVPKSYRPTWMNIVEGLIDGAKSGAQIGVITGAVGILLTTFSGSGIGVKLSIGIEQWSGGYLFVALLILWAVSILFGMVGVATVGYFTAAAFGVPVLTKLGVPFETAHFFVVFPAVFAFITPPVALAVIVAAKMAGADYMKASIEACRAAFSAFLLPFLIVYAPSIIFKTSVLSFTFWFELALCIIFLFGLQFAFVGYFKTKMEIWEQVLWTIGCTFILLFLINRIPILLVLGILMVGFGFVIQWKKGKNKQMITSVDASLSK